MLENVRSFQRGELGLGHLGTDIRAEYVEADPHEGRIRDEFEAKWSPIDAENELRTESWAPLGAASDDRLREVLGAFRTWVEQVLASDMTTDHQ
jgi:hypothetical protein